MILLLIPAIDFKEQREATFVIHYDQQQTDEFLRHTKKNYHHGCAQSL
jgi:hypothetical protein